MRIFQLHSGHPYVSDCTQTIYQQPCRLQDCYSVSLIGWGYEGHGIYDKVALIFGLLRIWVHPAVKGQKMLIHGQRGWPPTAHECLHFHGNWITYSCPGTPRAKTSCDRMWYHSIPILYLPNYIWDRYNILL